jgi:ABC-type transport system involved in multi-copper enzyme maturation permease subunit
MPNANVAARPTRPGPVRRAWARLVREARNPVVVKELRGRMRGARAIALLTFHLTVMSAYVGGINLMYAATANQVYNSFTPQTLGKNIFIGLVFIELILASFITPAITAGAVSGERERQTLDLLRTTLLPTPAFVLGKLFSALVFVILMLAAGIPLQSLSFLLGGVAPFDVVVASALLLASAFLFGSAGLLFSTLVRRTLGATVLTYGFALLSTLGLPLLLLPWFIFGYSIYVPVPLQALGQYAVYLLSITNPVATAFLTEGALTGYQTYFYYTTYLYSNYGATIALPFISPWLPFTLFALVAGTLMLLVSIGLIRRADRQ